MLSQKTNIQNARSNILRFFLLGLSVSVITGCVSSITKPDSSSSSLIMMSIEAVRTLGSNKPEVVTIARKSDGKEFKYTNQDGKYYFFANLPEGVYQIKKAAILIKGGSTSSQVGNVTTSTTSNIASYFPFDESIIEASTTKLSSGSVAFLGNITAEGTSKLFPPGAIEVSNVKLSKTEQDKNSIYSYFKQEFKDSPWVSYIN